jgi:hypothetical protein
VSTLTTSFLPPRARQFASCAALLLPQLGLLAVALHKGTAVGHCCALLGLTCALLAALSWFLSQVGLVDWAAQAGELGLDAPAPAVPDDPSSQKKED